MTREDAVERLNALKQFIGYDKDSEIVKATQKSLDMAIKALEHPEKNVIAVVPCGDAISRAEVLKLMQDNWHTHNGDWAMQESMDDIRALPSITPQEPKKGHWIETAEEYYKAINEKGGGVNENTPYFTDDIACSECLAKFSVIDNEAERFDFCPCCGSDNK